MTASYTRLIEDGQLAGRAQALRELLAPCRLCPRECGVDRLSSSEGACRSGAVAKVASFSPHFGEEAPLVGTQGSGTIFLSNCNLRCVFCQNHNISQSGAGREAGPEVLASMMLKLQKLGCHNINLVTPTHFAPQLVEALTIAAQRGLSVPIVYNCGGYESLEVLRLLEGIVDIYMPDAKWADSDTGERLSGVPSYPDHMMAAIREMHRQVGDLVLGPRGVAQRGLLVRHLVMPHDLAGTPQIMQFLASVSRDTYVNVMAQYRPCHQAHNHAHIDRPLTSEEYRRAVRAALEAGLHRLDEEPSRRP